MTLVGRKLIRTLALLAGIFVASWCLVYWHQGEPAILFTSRLAYAYTYATTDAESFIGQQSTDNTVTPSTLGSTVEEDISAGEGSSGNVDIKW